MVIRNIFMRLIFFLRLMVENLSIFFPLTANFFFTVLRPSVDPIKTLYLISNILESLSNVPLIHFHTMRRKKALFFCTVRRWPQIESFLIKPSQAC